MSELAALRYMAALILVRRPFVGNEEDFAAMVRASWKDAAREARRRKRDAKRRAEEQEMWELDKSLSPEPIRDALTELGY